MTVLEDSKTLSALGLAPAARVYLSWGTVKTRSKYVNRECTHSTRLLCPRL